MRLVFLDLETGGLDHTKHPITQIAAVAADADFNEEEAFEAKLDFDVKAADPEALNLSSYHSETWEQESRPPLHACSDLSRFLKKYADVRMVSKRTGSEYFVAQLAGYNAATFDGPFLREFYKQQGQFMPAAFRVMCVLQQTLWHFHKTDAEPPPDFKLVTVCEHFGIELANAHDALADCRATVALCRELTTRT